MSATTSSTLKLRLLRQGDAPATNPKARAYAFGLQDKDQNIIAGHKLPGGVFAFDFTVTVKNDKHGAPAFIGPFASGPPGDRFIYLSWKLKTGGYINRVKARLSTITWKQIEQAQAKDLGLVADMSGWTPGDERKFVTWALVKN